MKEWESNNYKNENCMIFNSRFNAEYKNPKLVGRSNCVHIWLIFL